MSELPEKDLTEVGPAVKPEGENPSVILPESAQEPFNDAAQAARRVRALIDALATKAPGEKDEKSHEPRHSIDAVKEDQAEISRFVELHGQFLAKIPEQFHIFYKMGAMDAAAMNARIAEGGEPMIPGAEEGAPTLQEINAVLQMMVSGGSIPPEYAQALMNELVEGEMTGSPDIVDDLENGSESKPE